MEDKKGLDNILLNATRKNNNQKVILLVAIGVLLIIIFALILIISKMGNANKLQEAQVSGFESKEDGSGEETQDRFEEIVRQIQKRAEEEAGTKSKVVVNEVKPIQKTPAIESTSNRKEEKALASKNTPAKPQPQTQVPKSIPVDKTKQGSKAEAGHYLQVGIFANDPNKTFMDKISQFNYRILETENGKKYLIGPYATKAKAQSDVARAKELLGDKLFYFEVK